MTAPYDHDALWLKAKMFLNRAMDEKEARSFDERALWATLALELLGKAALARTSPVLIAEPSEDGTNLLIATGLLDGDAQFMSVRAKTVFLRCQRAFRPFSAEEALKLTSARNEYLHGATPGFTSIPEEAWWPLFWRQAIILNNTVDKDLAELVGKDRETIVEKNLEQNRRNIEHRTEMLIQQAKTRLSQYRAGTLPARIAKQWSPGFDKSAGLPRCNQTTCPACGEMGLVEGEEIHDREIEGHQVDEAEWAYIVTLTVYAEYFSCSNCGLVLDRTELVEQAGIESIFEVEGTEDDLAHYFGEEYGND
ncbi:hypothetical protein [Mycobacterium riyadhense]|uniref:Uncharacterized protein n=1 Tax=Mycobacterium riyadhense TaxID=486698 RepID=A0A1X2CEA1_9MYCO|nr:hypothetical protein [Mycobacterium riyadhense]MCV7144645.1 hypothetical protein [Mycobacterium riyadhense]ORW74114.1 hypothetical protein AWC22_23615 [Mycobacterium riyadhense]